MLSNKAISILSACILGLGGLFSLHELAYYQKIYPRIRVDAVEISNLTLEDAEERLAAALPASPGALSLTFGGLNYPLPLNDLDLVYDSKATAQTAFLIGRKGQVI